MVEKGVCALAKLLVESMYFGYVSPVLKEVSFSVAPGEILAVSGPNGSGKTTILKTLRGITKELGGVARLNGISMEAQERLATQNLSFLPSENVGAWPDLTLKENFLFFLSYRGHSNAVASKIWDQVSGELLLKAIGNKRYSLCSTGERRALHILSHLATGPGRVILLDEPFAHLDDLKSVGIFNIIKEQNLTCVVTVQNAHLSKWRDRFKNVVQLEGAT